MTVKFTKLETLAQEIGGLVGQVGTINATIDSKCADIRKILKGKKIGTVKSGDAVMIRFKEAQEKLGTLKPQTINNNLVTFRKAINEGKAYDVNAIRKAKGSQAGKGKVAPTTGVKFKGDAKLDDIVKGLRSMFNKFKENDKTTSLASYLIDALDDFEGESK